MYNCCSVYNPPGGAAGAVTGSGTLNYVSKWTPDGSTLGDSQIFDNGTNVGVGTNIPSSYFDIIKAQNAATIVSISNSNAGNASRAGYYAASEDNNLSFQVYSSTLTNTYLRNNAVLYGGKRALRIIGDADGAGSGTITFGIGSATSTSEFATVDASGNWNFYSPAGSPSLTARIGVTGSGTTSATYTAIFQNGAATPLKLMYMQDGGNIGYGVDPSYFAHWKTATNKEIAFTNLGTGLGMQFMRSGAGVDFTNKIYPNDFSAGAYQMLAFESRSGYRFFINGTTTPAFDVRERIAPSSVVAINSAADTDVTLKVTCADNNTYGVKIAHTTASQGIDAYGIYTTKSGTNSANNIAGYFSATNGAKNYALVLVGGISAALQTGNAGTVTGDWYVDTAANILANGDNIVAQKV